MSTIRHGLRGTSRGQSLTEFALLVPVLLLLVMAGLDFGRIYLGWVNLQSMARIAAGYAANNTDGWEAPGDPDIVASYQTRVWEDARLTNCRIPDLAADANSTPDDKADVPQPVFSGGFDLGDPVQVRLECKFGVITPIISTILGGTIDVAASAVFPVTSGAVTAIPGGGGPPVPPPTAQFRGSALSGYAPLAVIFTDLSTDNPSTWQWNFGVGEGTSTLRNPTHTYNTPGLYRVQLRVQNISGTSTETKDDYIEVLAPPVTGPIPEFSAMPRSGNAPFDVSFTDESTPTGTITAYAWDFETDGTIDSTLRNPLHRYNASGVYDVTLTVTSATGTNSQTKVAFIVVSRRVCTVPNFAGARKNDAQDIWQQNGFSTAVQFQQGNGNYKINTQSLPGNLPDPPGGCTDAVVTVGP